MLLLLRPRAAGIGPSLRLPTATTTATRLVAAGRMVTNMTTTATAGFMTGDTIPWCQLDFQLNDLVPLRIAAITLRDRQQFAQPAPQRQGLEFIQHVRRRLGYRILRFFLLYRRRRNGFNLHQSFRRSIFLAEILFGGHIGVQLVIQIRHCQLKSGAHLAANPAFDHARVIFSWRSSSAPQPL